MNSVESTVKRMELVQKVCSWGALFIVALGGSLFMPFILSGLLALIVALSIYAGFLFLVIKPYATRVDGVLADLDAAADQMRREKETKAVAVDATPAQHSEGEQQA